MNEESKKKELIYERLAPGEVFIISKDENGCLEVVENKEGETVLKKVCPLTEK